MYIINGFFSFFFSFVVSRDGDSRTLTIIKSVIEDSAEYTCVLEAQKVSTILQVEIPRVAPTVASESTRTDFWVKKGEDADLQVPFNAYPPPKADWNFKGKPIKKTKKYITSTTETTANLTVKQADVAEAGEYLCKLANECGEASAEINLRLLGKNSAFRLMHI